MTNNPSQPRKMDVYDAIDRRTKLSLNCVQVGVVQSFDASTQLATVKIAMKQVTNIDNQGVKTLQEYPLLLECPTFTLSGGSDFISMPISSGDNCLVLFNDRDIDAWLKSGDGGFPTTSRAHDLADGFCLVGVRPLTDSIASYLADGIRISHSVGAIMDFKDNLIESVATLFKHNGDMTVSGDLLVEGDAEIAQNLEVGGNMTITGDMFGNGGTVTINDNITQQSGKVLRAGNGATGTFTTVTVLNGIVTGGTT